MSNNQRIVRQRIRHRPSPLAGLFWFITKLILLWHTVIFYFISDSNRKIFSFITFEKLKNGLWLVLRGDVGPRSQTS